MQQLLPSNYQNGYLLDNKYQNDQFQSKVINIDRGVHLVLAPPGCGKTDILAERVVKALSHNIAPEDMLCLTFTNRAARGMRERIAQRLGVSVDGGLPNIFVGNVHKFCAHFLFSHGLLPANTTILDEADTVSVLKLITGQRAIFDWDKEFFEANYSKNAELKYETIEFVLNLQHVCYQIYTGVDINASIILERNCLDFCKSVFLSRGIEFGPHQLIEAYQGDNPQFRSWDIESSSFNQDSFDHLLQLCRMYEEFKQENNFVDFDDLLIKTYNYVLQNYDSVKKYPWIQVDEMQDLSPLQFALIDLFSGCSPEQVTIFLGDEQQAIYSFIGAKLETLQDLCQTCGESNIHRLYHNYRSPKYLLDVFNSYAVKVLGMSAKLLPKPVQNTEVNDGKLVILQSPNDISEVASLVNLTYTLNKAKPDERIALLVRRNSEADQLSDALAQSNIKHFKVSGKDLFTFKTTKTLLAHLSVLNFEFNAMAWARLMSSIKIFNNVATALDFISYIRNAGMLPSDLLFYKNSSFLANLCNCHDNYEYVIFDTETTGLNVFEDDIVQIAALKCRGKVIIDEFNIILETEREIPAVLGDIVNPLVEEYASKPHVPRAQGLQMFLKFIGNCALIGHNVEYDYHILDFNLKREGVCPDFSQRYPVYFDTLKAIRLIEPKLGSYKLKNLIERFNLEGVNSHLANDDIIATKSLLDIIVTMSYGKVQYMHSIWPQIGHIAANFAARYSAIYAEAKQNMYVRADTSRNPLPVPALVNEVYRFFNICCNNKWISPSPEYPEKLQLIMDFLTKDVIDLKQAPSFYEQLKTYMLDINTFREVDLCDSSCIKEKIFISTVHKAKGLEFENVILFNASDNTYPTYRESKDKVLIEESARLFYVGMTRAKKSLYLSYSASRVNRYGRVFPQSVSPFVSDLVGHFRLKSTNRHW